MPDAHATARRRQRNIAKNVEHNGTGRSPAPETTDVAIPRRSPRIFTGTIHWFARETR